MNDNHRCGVTDVATHVHCRAVEGELRVAAMVPHVEWEWKEVLHRGI